MVTAGMNFQSTPPQRRLSQPFWLTWRLRSVWVGTVALVWPSSSSLKMSNTCDAATIISPVGTIGPSGNTLPQADAYFRMAERTFVQKVVVLQGAAVASIRLVVGRCAVTMPECGT